MTTAWGKKFFYKCAACVCLTFGTTFLPILFNTAIGLLMGVMTISIFLTNWFIQISLEFRKRLVSKDFILKDNKLIAKLPWSFRKQSIIFVSSNSNLIFLGRSFLSAKTDPQVCVHLVLWKEPNKCFL